MKKTIIICLSLFLVFISGQAFAGKQGHQPQNQTTDTIGSITINEDIEIKYEAAVCLNRFESILNSIAFNDNTPDEINGYIKNSYTAGKSTRVFANNSVIVESDIDPRYILGNNKDLPVEKYLYDFHLAYEKLEDFNIKFTNVTVSDLKKTDHLYIRLRYDQDFGGKFKPTGASYPQRQREATIRIEKIGERKWQALIESITYFNPNLPIESNDHNLPIRTKQSNADNNAATEVEMQKAMIDKRKDVEDQQNQSKEQIIEFIKNGNKQKNIGQYEEALASYQKAMDIAKVDPKIYKEIRDTKRLVELNAHLDSLIKGPKDNLIKMVMVKGGTFNMGSNDAEDDASPIHKVKLNSFYIGKYEVTKTEWIAVMGKDSVDITENLDRPITNVSWEEVQTFINKLNQQTGKAYRLPTEAEWDYAAHGGKESKGYLYSGSDTISSVGWFLKDGTLETQPVGQKLGNELGIFDMSGNAWEWCQDWYNRNFYVDGPLNNPVCLTPGTNRIVRGGGRNSVALACKTSRRDSRLPNYRYESVGFRLALSK